VTAKQQQTECERELASLKWRRRIAVWLSLACAIGGIGLANSSFLPARVIFGLGVIFLVVGGVAMIVGIWVNLIIPGIEKRLMTQVPSPFEQLLQSSQEQRTDLTNRSSRAPSAPAELKR